MKKLLRLVLVLALATAGGYAWFLQSIHFVLLELKAGVEAPDLSRVDPYVDYDAIAKSMIDFGQAEVEISAEEMAGGIGKDIAGSLVNLFRAVNEGQTKKALKPEIRSSIAEGKFRELGGDFNPAEGFAAIDGIETPEEGKRRVTFKGQCRGGPALVAIDFVRAEGGRYGLPTWKCVGMHKESAKKLARVCHQNAKRAKR